LGHAGGRKVLEVLASLAGWSVVFLFTYFIFIDNFDEDVY
jgi:hypothetical protein